MRMGILVGFFQKKKKLWNKDKIDLTPSLILQQRIVALEEQNALVKSQVLRDSHKIRRLEEIADKAVNDTNLAGKIPK